MNRSSGCIANVIDASILLVEDDKPLAALTCDYLESEGYHVIVASTSEEARQAINQQVFDLILCDVMLPDRTGFNLVKNNLGKRDTPFLFISAMSDESYQIKGLTLGASDYLVKPVNPEILLLKIQNLLNHQSKKELSEIRFGPLYLNFNLGECKYQQEPVSLTPSEFQLLWLLALHPNQPVSREKLFEETVGREYDGMDRTIDGRVSRLRKKLENFQLSEVTIVTKWSQGYQLVQT